MDMLNEFLSENYSNEKAVQLCRWKKRLNKPIEELKGSDRTLIKLFDYCNKLYEENKKLSKATNVKDNISKVKPVNYYYIGLRNNNNRIDTSNIIIGELLKSVKFNDKPIIKDIIVQNNIEKEKEEKEYYMEGDIKVITSLKNHNIPCIISVMKGANRTINLEIKCRKSEGKTKDNIENYVEKHAFKTVLDRYDMICKGSNIKLNDELYEVLIIGILKKIKKDCIKLLENYY